MALDASMAGAGAGAAIGSAIAPGPGTIIGGAIGFLAPIIGDLIGRALGAGDQEEADRLIRQAIAEFGPDVLKAPGVAELTPHLNIPEMASVAADPRAIAAQHSALNRLDAASRPDDLEFRAATDAAAQEANRLAGAQQGAIRQQMQARGMGGSGVDFALRQQAGQDAANRSAGMGFDAAVAQRRNALDALDKYAAQAGEMRGQSFQEGSERARAVDAVNRFNETGRVAGAQQGFDNQLGLARARSNAYGQGAAHYGNKAAGTQQQWAGYGQGAGQAAGAIGQFVNSQGQQGLSEEEKRRRGIR